MKQLFAFLLVLAAASAASGQGACTLTLAQAPTVSGLRLGMKPEEVLALFPGSRADKEIRAYLTRPASLLGVSELIIKPERYSSKAKFAGVSQVSMTLLDNRVLTFNIGYTGPEYKHVDEFLGKFIEGKKLPAAHAWEPYVGMDTQLKTLKCKGFEINVFAGGKNVRNINYVELTDVAARQRLRDRRAKAREKRPTSRLRPM
ncbi:MAG TPA: hypothetical protein VJ715_13020 [Pyrinomonadaceae bacterium]|nr:hypothetical protein [Pyrinomonadaceae bacterium]